MRGGLEALRAELDAARPGLPAPGADEGARARARAIRRLDDFVLPRLDSLDAPLLAVIGGSTGAGKSTLVNTLVGRVVTAASPVRPTTRRPLLLHRPEDAAYFDAARILPGLARVPLDPEAPPAPSGTGSTGELEIRAAKALPRGLALIDSPDIDSVSAENRALARRLLDAADLWVFVTTAARYADDVPWRLLDEAARSGLVLGVVLNRLPDEAAAPVLADLRALMDGRGLAAAPVFAIPEAALEGGLLTEGSVGEVREWLAALAASADSRREVARVALSGAVLEICESAAILADAVDAAEEERRRACEVLDAVVSESLERLSAATADGSLLRGEVLARWNEVVGAAELTRSLSLAVSRVRDRLSAWVRGRPAPIEPVEDALEAGLSSLVLDELLTAEHEARSRWSRSDATRALATRIAPEGADAAERRALELTRAWQRLLLDLVREEGRGRRSSARIAAIGVNVVSVALIIAVFASTGGLTGAEVGIAGASAVLAQKLLETVFGDQAVRTMARRAREDLLRRMRLALEETLAPMREALPAEASSATLRQAAKEADASWRSA